MLVKDIMNREIITVKRSTTLGQLLEIFKNFHTFPLIPVIDEESKLVGTVSLQNIIEVFEPTKTELLKSIPFIEHNEIDISDLDILPEMKFLYIVDDLMDKKFLTVNEDMPLEKAYNFLKLNKIDEVLVVNSSGQLVGIVGIFDIVQEVFKRKGLL